MSSENTTTSSPSKLMSSREHLITIQMPDITKQLLSLGFPIDEILSGYMNELKFLFINRYGREGWFNFMRGQLENAKDILASDNPYWRAMDAKPGERGGH